MSEENSGSNTSYSLYVPLLPVFYHGTKSDGITSTSTTVTPLFYYSSGETGQNDGVLTGSTFWIPILPLFYKSSSGESSHWNLLGILDSSTEKEYSRFFLFPLYYSTMEAGESHTNILGVVDWWKDSKGITTSMVFPFYRWSGDDRSSSIILFPLLSYFGSGPEGKTRFVTGMYWHESPSYERQNFLYLFDHKKYIDQRYPSDQYSILFTTAAMDIDPEIVEMRLLWGALLN